jgi:hypothetical protein
LFALEAPRGAKSDVKLGRPRASMVLVDLARLKPKLRDLKRLSLCAPNASRARYFVALKIF